MALSKHDALHGELGGVVSRCKEPVGCSRAFSFHMDHFYVGHGQKHEYDEEYSDDQLLTFQRYNFTLGEWRGVSPMSADDEEEEKKLTREFMADGGMCCAVLRDHDCAYEFGGE